MSLLGLAAAGCGRLRHEAHDAGRDALVSTLDAPLDARTVVPPDTLASTDVFVGSDEDAAIDATSSPLDAGTDALVLAEDARPMEDAFTPVDAAAPIDAGPSRTDAALAALPLPVGRYLFEGNGNDEVLPAASFPCSGCSFVEGYRGSGVISPLLTLPSHPSSGDFSLTVWTRFDVPFPMTFASCGIVTSMTALLEVGDEPPTIGAYDGRVGSFAPYTAVTPATWTHAVLTYDSSLGRSCVYVDGTLRGCDVGGRSDALAPTRIGGLECLATIDELTLYDVTLDASQVAALRAL